MIDKEIEALRRDHSTLQAPAEERAARPGDQATITFQLEVDGVPKTEGPQEIETEIGSNQIMKELESALDGLRIGEHKDVEVTFSDRHPNADFRRKKGTFHVTLKDVRERLLPDVDDEFAKDCGEDTLEKLRAAQRAKLELALKQQTNDNLAQQLVAELCQLEPRPVPALPGRAAVAGHRARPLRPGAPRRPARRQQRPTSRPTSATTRR